MEAVGAGVSEVRPRRPRRFFASDRQRAYSQATVHANHLARGAARFHQQQDSSSGDLERPDRAVSTYSHRPVRHAAKHQSTRRRRRPLDGATWVDSRAPLQSVPAPEISVPARWRIAVILLVADLLVCLIALGNILWNRRLEGTATAKPSVARATGPLSVFWRPFISGGEEPWVIFSNAAFVGRPETGMRYYNSRQDSKVAVYDHYTGVGEVLAIHALDEAFGTLGQKIRVKRGSLFSLDDAKKTNLIFVGSPSENLSLLDIPNLQEFVFQRVALGPRQGDLSIVNKHPRPGEASAYLASPSGASLTEDYSVIGLVPGMGSGRDAMILAGTTTFGTQGGSGICLPPRYGGETAAWSPQLRHRAHKAFRGAGPRQDRSRRAGRSRAR